ncbi:MAG: PHP domain-containing protein, partial [Bacteroidales bacterium]|nr:PHP domain-containing protein [Bacteroidales bacterium]
MAHNAAADVEATARCFLELIRIDVIGTKKLGFTEDQLENFKISNPNSIKAIGLNTQAYNPHDIGDETVITKKDTSDSPIKKSGINLKDYTFSHLHLHTQYSILDGATPIPGIAKKAVKDGMKAVAITDHGNMFGVKTFHKALTKEGIKPILGCEVYVAKRGRLKQEGKQDGGGWHLVLLAKNKIGYVNLMKMVSTSWLDGFYYKPRIDKELLSQNHEGIIALSACLGGEINKKLMNESFEEA